MQNWTKTGLFREQLIRQILKDRHLICQMIPPDRREEYQAIRVIARGEFGVVVEAFSTKTRKPVAIKRFREDADIKSREVHILRSIDCRYLLKLNDYYYGPGISPRGRYAFIVMDLYPMTLGAYSATFSMPENPMPQIVRKLFAFQIFAGLNYLHQRNIVHRDIDLTNIFVDPDVGKLVIGDFGCAKVLEPDADSVPYMFSRPFRAPELILGQTRYGTAVDIWAAGCVYAQLLRGGQLFTGSSQYQFLHNIVSIVGTVPYAMLNKEMELKLHLPQSNSSLLEWELPGAAKEEIELLKHILVIDPAERWTAEQCMEHFCFDALFTGMASLPNRVPLPILDRGGYAQGIKMDFGQDGE
jgi:glycogen synthase kinase 3 beta